MSSERSDSELIDHDRRQLLASAAMGLAAAGVASMLPLHSAAAATGDAVRPAAKRAKVRKPGRFPGTLPDALPPWRLPNGSFGVDASGNGNEGSPRLKPHAMKMLYIRRA